MDGPPYRCDDHKDDGMGVRIPDNGCLECLQIYFKNQYDEPVNASDLVTVIEAVRSSLPKG